MESPSLFAIVKTDMAALAAAVFPLVSAVLAVLAEFGLAPSRRGTTLDSEGTLKIAAVAAVVGLVVLAWRVSKIRRAFAGTAVPGTLVRIEAWRDRARLTYRYVHERQPHVGTHLVHQTDATRTLREGQAITVAVADDDARCAYVVEVFR